MSFADLKETLGLVVVGAARTVPMAWSIPVFGGPTLPGQLRLALGIGLSLFCLPVLAGSPPIGDAVRWVLIAFREIMVGVVMGFVCACTFRAAEAAGQFTDVLRGGNMARVLSPTGEGRSSPLGTLFLLLAILVFFEIGGPGHVMSALVRSYEAIPLGLSSQVADRSRAMAILAIVASAKLIESAIGLCAPAIVALLLADLLLGLLGRAVPQMPIHSFGMPLKALLGVGVVLLTLAGLDVALQSSFRGFLDLLGTAMRFGR